MRSKTAIWFFAISAFATSLSAIPKAHAQSDKIAAEALFEEGRRLMAEGNVAEACPKFADSQRLDPTPGTLLNLANCYEKVSRTATAWLTYRQAASLASAQGRADLLATAQRRADAIAPRLRRVTINVTVPVDGMQIKRDGSPVALSERGLAIPVDQGKHLIEVSAPAKKTWTTTVEILEGGPNPVVTVPALEDAPVEALPPQPTDPTAATPANQFSDSSGAPPAPSTGLGGQRIAALAVGGVGIIGVGVGTAFVFIAKSRFDDSKKNCPNSENLCTSEGVSKRDDARSAGTIATIAIGAGAAAIAAGAALWILAPSESAEKKTAGTIEFVPGIGTAMIRGTW